MVMNKNCAVVCGWLCITAIVITCILVFKNAWALVLLFACTGLDKEDKPNE
jgi:hypothetical protein